MTSCACDELRFGKGDVKTLVHAAQIFCTVVHKVAMESIKLFFGNACHMFFVKFMLDEVKDFCPELLPLL